MSKDWEMSRVSWFYKKEAGRSKLAYALGKKNIHEFHQSEEG